MDSLEKLHKQLREVYKNIESLEDQVNRTAYFNDVSTTDKEVLIDLLKQLKQNMVNTEQAYNEDLLSIDFQLNEGKLWT